MTIELLRDALERAVRYLDGLATRRVFPGDEALAELSRFGEPLPAGPTEPADVLDLLDRAGSPATVATAGGRYFGFVTGGALPATVAASWLAAAWDQCAGLRPLSPVAVKLEDVSREWLLDLLDLPREAVVGFVTGATTANFTCLAAARHELLARRGWNVEAQGLFGAPELRVVVGDEVHASLLKALGMLGLGRERVERVPVDDQGRMRADALPPLDDATIVCLQAGNVNTGAFDPAPEICVAAREAGSWVHVDGAFGLWALASPAKRHLAAGVPDADSWAADAHKWLNVPYDSGLAFCRNPAALRAAMTIVAPYLLPTAEPEPNHFVPEMSRRARGIEVWAALRSLGREGVAALIERNCRQAARFADALRDAGCEILNDVVLNQVLVSFGAAETTNRVIARVQEEGTMWAGGTVWQGRTAMRISVSSWATTDKDVERSIEAILRMRAGAS
ncbi:MAG TPA: aminotransferase class V-fold PLP-dependent enzyme [Gemmatimonadota bacterium]|nr:aminotransferase class V-fold PLP-dependent enzyme [Gemmatimonadota bacterium]